MLEGVGLGDGSPVFIDGEKEAAFEEPAEVGFCGDRKGFEAGGGLNPCFGFEEGKTAINDRQGVTLGVVERGGVGADVAGLAAEEFSGGVKWGATLPLLDDIGVAGFGHCSRAPVAGYQQGVVVEPAYGLLTAREDEAIFNEFAVFKVELAESVGVFTTG